MEQPFDHDHLHNVIVDWGSTTEYPDATEADIGDTPIDAKFSSYAITSKTVAHYGKLIGFTKTCDGVVWLDDDADDWEFCQVKSTLDNGNPISTYPEGNYNTHLLLMGGKWISGSRSTNDKVFWSDGKTMSWDEENQPTRWKPLSNIEDDGTEHDE
jgi:hypothetical protein